MAQMSGTYLGLYKARGGDSLAFRQHYENRVRAKARDEEAGVGAEFAGQQHRPSRADCGCAYDDGTSVQGLQENSNYRLARFRQDH